VFLFLSLCDIAFAGAPLSQEPQAIKDAWSRAVQSWNRCLGSVGALSTTEKGTDPIFLRRASSVCLETFAATTHEIVLVSSPKNKMDGTLQSLPERSNSTLRYLSQCAGSDHPFDFI
jgi:hypothetical protein